MCTPLSLSSAQRKKTRYVQRRKLTAIHVGTYKLTVWNSACLFNVFIASKFAQRTLVASDNICSNVLPISAWWRTRSPRTTCSTHSPRVTSPDHFRSPRRRWSWISAWASKWTPRYLLDPASGAKESGSRSLAANGPVDGVRVSFW